MKTEQTDICIVGGGPAGMILGLLLAQKGIDVTVLESHKDFEREYRGEVLMPRFIKAVTAAGIFDIIAREHHLKLNAIELFFKSHLLAGAVFAKICPEIPYAIWMPQPILLNALYKETRKYPNFKMRFSTIVRDLLSKDGTITGVVAEQQGEKVEISAKITVGADGRSSIVRKTGDFKLRYDFYNFDVVWFTIKHPKDYDQTVRAFFSPHHNYLILPKYPDAIQCGLFVPPGGFTKIRQDGVEKLRQELLSGHSLLHPFARTLEDFKPFHVLQARIDFVDEWARDGCVLIGDAAHTCSPAGAIGVAVATQTAIAAVPVLLDALQRKDYSAKSLGRIQAVREKDVISVHRIQAGFTNLVFSRFPGSKPLIMAVIFLIGRLGFFVRLQRKLAVG